MGMQTVLLVEDEESFIDALTIGLKKEGFRVEVARDGMEALAKFDIVQPDVVLLDVMLPKISGIDVCRQLRKRTQVPIIMVTAKGAEIDTVVGLEVGADDYITKPFALRELLARIKALLRRAKSSDDRNLLVVRDLTIDIDSRRAFVGEEALQLGPTEFNLLLFFMSHPERAYTRSQLLDRVWGANIYVEERTVDVHIRRLRAALDAAEGDYSQLIQTVRGTGYRFSEQGG